LLNTGRRKEESVSFELDTNWEKITFTIKKMYKIAVNSLLTETKKKHAFN